MTADRKRPCGVAWMSWLIHIFFGSFIRLVYLRHRKVAEPTNVEDDVVNGDGWPRCLPGSGHARARLHEHEPPLFLFYSFYPPTVFQ